MLLSEIKDFLNNSNLKFDDNIIDELSRIKNKAILEKNEQLANEIWCLQKVFTIQKSYISMYNDLKSGKYEKAWNTLERVDIELSFLRENFDYSKNKFNMLFIEKIIKYYEILFPYQYFFSRESIIKTEKCSICGKKALIRGGCEHRIGKLYMGEMCLREVTDFEILGVSLVKNPFDKYGFIRVPEKEYNYEALEYLMSNILSPFEHWYVEESKIKNHEFIVTGRNDSCPCGSGLKYKKCCINTEKEMMQHYRITFLGRTMKETHISFINTWKQ